MQNRSRGKRILQRRQPASIQLVKRDPPFIQRRDGIDELLEADVSVPGLAAEIAFFVGRVAHVEGVVPDQLALAVVVCDVVAAFCLVDADFAPGAHP